MEVNKIDVIIKKLEDLENGQRQGFAVVGMALERIEKKISDIPSTYENNEKLLGGALRDIELIKKIILNQ
jgi:hypothetical protein